MGGALCDTSLLSDNVAGWLQPGLGNFSAVTVLKLLLVTRLQHVESLFGMYSS